MTDKIEHGAIIANPFAIVDGAIQHAATFVADSGAEIQCPSCNGRMHFKHSSRGLPFFAHNSNSNCSPYETGLHIYAKELLFRERRLTIPEMTDRGGVLAEAKDVIFDECFVERANFEFQYKPDILGVIQRGATQHYLNVEFHVHNAIDEIKEKKILRSDISTVEISLNPFLTAGMEPTELDHYILHRSDRIWVYIKGETRSKLYEKRDKLKKEREYRFVSKFNEVVAAPSLCEGRGYKDSVVYACGKFLHEIGFPDKLSVNVPGEEFLCDPNGVWQVIYWKMVLLDRMRDEKEEFMIPLRYRMTSDLHLRSINEIYRRDVWAAYMELSDAGFSNSVKILAPIAAYLRHMSELSDIVVFEDGYAFVNKVYSRRVWRRQKLDKIIIPSFARIPNESARKTRKRQWLNQIVDGYAMTPLQMAFNGGQEWEHLAAEIKRINRAVLHAREPVDDILGLPFYLENERNTGRMSPSQRLEERYPVAKEIDRLRAKYRDR